MNTTANWKLPIHGQSSWYEWPTMIRPMYYYCQTLRDGMKEGISAFGNPLVWWAGIPALILILLPFGRRRSNRLGSKTSQWLQSIGCEFFVFLALWSVFVKQSSSNGGGDSWKLYGPFLIVLGVASALYIAYQLVTRGDKKALFMVFAYAVQLLPWILVPRWYICLSLFSKCAICRHDDCVRYGKTCGCGQKMVQMVYGLSGSCLFPVLSFLSGTFRTADL